MTVLSETSGGGGALSTFFPLEDPRNANCDNHGNGNEDLDENDGKQPSIQKSIRQDCRGRQHGVVVIQ